MTTRRNAAVIVAAGLSSRMGAFKPLLDLGGKTIAQHVVETFRDAGVEQIVMVTGYRADELEQHLEPYDLCFVRNERYAETHMFDSACLGFEPLAGSVDRVLFTPVDVPLFSADTVRALLDSDAEFARPVCNGRAGHPIVFDAALLPAILSDSGEGGLKGALGRCTDREVDIPVKDPGVLQDADTPEDYRVLKQIKKADKR